jgi:N-acetylmuramoyl-L-alanine amidase
MFAKWVKKYFVEWFVRGLIIALVGPTAVFAQTILSVNLVPTQDYSRLTFETHNAIQADVFVLDNPNRIVMDLSGVELNAALQDLKTKIKNDDPYILSVRIAQNKPEVARVVFDLKEPVKVNTNVLEPMGEYGYRLVLEFFSKTGKSSEVVHENTQPYLSQDEPSKQAVPVQGANENPISPVPNVMAEPDVLIAVDAGHGGVDPGAHGRQGSREKNVTLAIARKLASLINQTPHLKAVLTRDGDYFVPLQERTAKAKRAKADLFVSIHADAYPDQAARGSSVFALSEKGATSVAANWLANHENDVDLIGGVNLSNQPQNLAQTLLDLSQTATINDSLKLAHSILNSVGQLNLLHRGHVEQAGFVVLKTPDIPSVLVETAFITNPMEELRLNDADYQDQLAHKILSGIQAYLSTHPSLNSSRDVQSSLATDHRNLAVNP